MRLIRCSSPNLDECSYQLATILRASPKMRLVAVFDCFLDIWQIDKSASGEVTKTKLFGVRVRRPTSHALRILTRVSMFH